VTLSATEAARLDALGALGPVGWSAADIDTEIARTRASYVAERQALPQTEDF